MIATINDVIIINKWEMLAPSGARHYDRLLYYIINLCHITLIGHEIKSLVLSIKYVYESEGITDNMRKVQFNVRIYKHICIFKTFSFVFFYF